MQCKSNLPLLLLSWLLLSLACTSQQAVPGTYQSRDTQGQETPIVLSLDRAGKGIFKIGGQEIPLKWEAKNGEIWLHLKSGGVIVGQLTDADAIDISLPGPVRYLLKKNTEKSPHGK